MNPRPRLYFLDHLKVILTCLVVAHHAGQAYGGSGGFWYFKSVQTTNLGHFFMVNAAFFMSLFFLISAYFMPGSFDRKGTRRFLTDRLQRLGVPLLMAGLLFLPLVHYAYFLHYRPYPKLSFLAYYGQYYLGFGTRPSDWSGPSWPELNFGNAWFIEHLLVYGLIYALWRTVFRKKAASVQTQQLKLDQGKAPGFLAIFLFTVALAIVTFLVRTVSPIDAWTGLLGFIQVEYAHLPQYASFFVIGLIAARRNWIQNVSAGVGRVWLGIGVVLAILGYAGIGDALHFTGGGWKWGSLMFALYDTFLCSGMCIGLLYLYRETMNFKSTFWAKLAENAFTVYLIHFPLVVAIQYLMGGLSAPAVLKFILVSLLDILLSFLLSHYVVRRIPYLKKIL